MNLFVTDSDPSVASTHLDDVRLNKMILESCQMLLTAMANNGLDRNSMPLTKSGTVFKTMGFRNHPVTVWTGLTTSNMEWHLQYLKGMLNEYILRFNKSHSLARIAEFVQNNYNSVTPEGAITPFQNSSEFKQNSNTIEAYRAGMNLKWNKDVIKVKWTNRVPPDWLSIAVIVINNVHWRISDAPINLNSQVTGVTYQFSATDAPNIKLS